METSKNELRRAITYLKDSGLTWVPDKLKDHLFLSQSPATLGRKFRAHSEGDNPELLRTYYVNDKGRKIAQYAYNPNYKENV